MNPIEHAIEALATRIAAEGTTPNSAPVRRSFSLSGRFRIYFNRHQAAPLVWCIMSDRGNFELAVPAVEIDAPARTIYRPKATPDDEDGLPSAWLEVDGVITVDVDSQIVRITRAG